ncbi:excisionase family DNA-binding protein [Paracoccus sp. KR1-242]|uniref:excisionase family DNA-binding protein n=1 Tax=Paracoccus sp. KR1-242 TaxID=3410028 RepID=UPI003C0FE673
MFDERRPFTPETLADRWECSATMVRNMAASGQIRSFRVGKLYRIPHAAVEEYEAAAAIEKKAPAQPPTGDVIFVRHTTPRRRRTMKDDEDQSMDRAQKAAAALKKSRSKLD